ncbi:MAG: methyltransferase [Alphaproteobacteria bacterium]|nr:methyltransferase [Alphaproteobacteria bacterium]
MHPAPLHAVYGTPPAHLLPLPEGAQPCSPLIPGSAALEDYAPESLRSAVIYAPANTTERRYTLALALRALAVGAPLTALAPADKGGRRLAMELAGFGCATTGEARRHHRIVSCTRPAQLLQIDEALAAGALHRHPAHGLWTQAGIFSWDRLDAGSALLLKHLPEFAGRGADLGCGLGVLSQQVLRSARVRELTAIDIDRRAISAAEKNLDDARARFIWADVRTTETDFPHNLDFVVMNPPFHDAGIEDKSLGQAFIRRAAAMLDSGGACWLVANRHLPYEAVFGECFLSHRLIADAEGFKIIEGIK